jgi:hypothetical protein
MYKKKPLYRKVNTRARNVSHFKGGDYKYGRNTKQAERDPKSLASMRGKVQRGLDYTPLFQFLLSKVGEDWDNIHSEAVARLDKEEPIYWMVARNEAEQRPYVRIGESTYYSGLYVDENNKLALVDPNMRVESMEPLCACCTHTFNGAPFVRKFAG